MTSERHYRSIICAFLAIFILSIIGCSPIHRLRRIIRNHPNLTNEIYEDSIIIDSVKAKDTILLFKKDTITIEGIRIIRRGVDSIRIVADVRPCTTIIKKTILRPTKSKGEIRQERKSVKLEAKIARKAEAKSKVVFFGFFLGLIIGIFMTLLIVNKNAGIKRH